MYWLTLAPWAVRQHINTELFVEEEKVGQFVQVKTGNTTLSMMTHSIKGLIATVSMSTFTFCLKSHFIYCYAECRYSECCVAISKCPRIPNLAHTSLEIQTHFCLLRPRSILTVVALPREPRHRLLRFWQQNRLCKRTLRWNKVCGSKEWLNNLEKPGKTNGGEGSVLLTSSEN
jgi:hypothetical protein